LETRNFSLGSAGPAAAQTAWNLSPAHCTQNATASGSFGNTWTCPSGTPSTSVTLSAWSSDRGTTRTGTGAAVTDANSYVLSGSGFASAFLSPQGNSGFGAVSRLEAQEARLAGDTTPLTPGSPNHAFDSISPGTIDLLLLNFSSSIVLSQIGIGWTAGDADVTVLRWAGAGSPFIADGSSTMIGDGHGNLSNTLGSTGWSLVGSYSNLATDNTVPFGGAARNTGATDAMASSWWLVSTFNTTLNGGTRNCTAADGKTTTCLPSSLVGNDSFKFNYVAFRTPTPPPPGQVSEPASLALLGIAALAWVASSSRRRPTAAA
jgi:hypothetical protein